MDDMNPREEHMLLKEKKARPPRGGGGQRPNAPPRTVEQSLSDETSIAEAARDSEGGGDGDDKAGRFSCGRFVGG